jgi:hypothetical protein
LTILNDKGIPVLAYDSFLSDVQYGMYKSHTFSIKNYDVMSKINYEHLQRSIAGMTSIELTKYAVKSLLLWSEDSHYMFMQGHIMSPNKKGIPEQMVKLYTKLKIMGSNYYEDKINRNTYQNNEWVTQKKDIIQMEEFDYVGIIQGSKFKIRKKSNAEAYIKDNRNVERGVNCTNIDKNKVAKIMKLFNLEVSKPRIKSSCNKLFAAFVEKEIKSKWGHDNKKYLYLFNE